jgi:hypothetical protein
MLDSEVLLGRASSMPNPGVTESLCSGRISPNNRPVWRGATGGTVLTGRGPVEPEVRGRAMRLANDCELAAGGSRVGLLVR